LVMCRSRLAAISTEEVEDPLGHLEGERAGGVRDVIGLIFEFSEDSKSAKALVEKILSRLR
jgi:hypothetical protein